MLRFTPLAVTSLLLTFTTLQSTTRAQDFGFDRWSPGTVGQSLDLRFTGAPAGTTLLAMLSTNLGPTPLSLLNVADPRVLNVGLELSHVWFPLPTGSGQGTILIPVPLDASLAGAMFHWQAATLPGATFLVDRISNRVLTQFGVRNSVTNMPLSLPQARALGSTFFGSSVAGSQGEVVYAGGGQGTLLGAVGLNTSNIMDVRTLQWRAGPNMTIARALPVSVPLSGGRVLLAGGVDAAGVVTNTCEIYDPVSRTFSPTASMAVARGAHSGALLPDGRVLVVGGTTTFTDPIAALANAQASTEIYNPTTGTWTRGPNIGSRRIAPGLITMSNGRVLMSGGFEVTVLFGIPLPTGSVASCQSYNPTTNSWSSAAAMRTARGAHGVNMVTLSDGRVLVTGGASSGPDLTQAAAIANAETYNPTTNVWTALPDMPSSIATHTVNVLPDGRVILAGGTTGTLATPTAVDSVYLFSQTSNTFSTLPTLTTTRGGHGSAVLSDGALVLFGGNGGPSNQSMASVEILR